MSGLMDLLSNDFLPKFLAGMVVNFEIAAIALVIGLALGLLLAAGRLSGGVVTAITVSIISLMRAAPTFVVMFFLLNAIPRDATLFGAPFALSGVMTVALSLVPYSAAYVADAGVDSMRHLRAGTTHGRIPVLPQHHPRVLRAGDVVERRRRDRRHRGHHRHPAPGRAAARASTTGWCCSPSASCCSASRCRRASC